MHLLVHFLKEKLTIKQRSAVAIIGLSGIILLGIAWNWDEMVYNITHHRMQTMPNKINIELCLQKSNFIQVGDEIEETLKGDICIKELNEGIRNRQPEYYAVAQVCNQDTDVLIEIILTEEEYNTLEENKHYYLVRKKYYNLDGWNIRTEDTVYKSYEDYFKTIQ